MQLLWAWLVLAAVVGGSVEEGAGHVYNQLTQQIPRTGRSSEFVPAEKKTNRMKYFYAEIPKAMPRIGRGAANAIEQPLISTLFDDHPIRLTSLLSSLRRSQSFDQDDKQCLTLRHLIQIQAFGTVLSNRGSAGTSINTSGEQSGWTDARDGSKEEKSTKYQSLPPKPSFQWRDE